MEEKIMRVTDMVMHIGNNLGEDSRRNVEKALTGNKGVIHAHFNEKRPHLMLVYYDTEATTSFEILAQMTGQQLCAERVG
jgi:UDP-N-acetylglucosamine 2-epimerase